MPHEGGPSRLEIGALGANAELLEKYVKNFDLAEQRIKKTENGTRAFQEAAINELRYSARHVIQAISREPLPTETETAELLDHGDLGATRSESAAAKELRRANDHCLRARYDAIEIEALYYLEAIEKFLSDYRLVPLDGELQATYIEAVKRAKAATAFTERPAGVGDDRPQRLEELDQHCSALKEALDQCEACRIPLNNRILELRKQSGGNKLLLVATIVAAAGGWVAAAAAWTTLWAQHANNQSLPQVHLANSALSGTPPRSRP